MTTVFLKLSGGSEQWLAALDAVHPGILPRNEYGGVSLPIRSHYTHGIAVHVFPRLMIKPAVLSNTEVDAEGNPIVLVPAEIEEGPFVMLKALDGQVLGPLRAGLTRRWQSSAAPIRFFGD